MTSLIKKLKKKYLGKYYAREREQGPTSIYKVVELIYDFKCKIYFLSCVELTCHSSYMCPIEGFHKETCKIAVEHFPKITKRCSIKWVKGMVDVWKKDLDEFAIPLKEEINE